MVTLGTKTQYGEVVGVTWIDERYYFCLKKGVVSLMPAIVVENL